MRAKKAAETAGEALPLVSVESTPQELIRQIDADASLVPTRSLVPFYVQGHKIVAQINALLDKAKAELKARRDEGKPYGMEGEHRKLQFGDFSVQVESRKKWTLDPVLAAEYLKKRGLWEDACNLVIESGVEELQQFLAKNKKFVRESGLQVTEVLNEDKVQALVQLKKIPLADFESLIRKGEPTYALKVGKT
jgi:hypothetical protein